MLKQLVVVGVYVRLYRRLLSHHDGRSCVNLPDSQEFGRWEESNIIQVRPMSCHSDDTIGYVMMI